MRRMGRSNDIVSQTSCDFVLLLLLLLLVLRLLLLLVLVLLLVLLTHPCLALPPRLSH